MDYRVLFLQLYRFLSTFSFSFISLKRKLLTSVSSKIIITDTSSLIVIVNLRFLQRPQKAKSEEPAYSQSLVQNKIDWQRVRSRESGKQTVRRLWWMVFAVETGTEVGEKRIQQETK